MELAVWYGACLQDEEVAEHKIGEAAGHDVDKWQDETPYDKDAPRLRQLQQVCDLKSREIIHAEEQDQSLQEPHIQSNTSLELTKCVPLSAV